MKQNNLDSSAALVFGRNGVCKFSFISKFSKCVHVSSDFKNLRSLDLCGGRLTDAGVKNMKDLSSLMFLNLSQNLKLTNTALEYLSGNFLNIYFVRSMNTSISSNVRQNCCYGLFIRS